VRVKVIALDLEGTLIDNALSGRPRPGLYKFLDFCNEQFSRVAVFTTVEETDAREVLSDLAESGHIPSELFASLEYVEWCGEYKDLAFLTDTVLGDVLLVDDDAGWIRPDQRERWVQIATWDDGPDRELIRIRSVLEKWLTGGV
jgi:hypothetical protein